MPPKMTQYLRQCSGQQCIIPMLMVQAAGHTPKSEACRAHCRGSIGPDAWPPCCSTAPAQHLSRAGRQQRCEAPDGTCRGTVESEGSRGPQLPEERGAGTCHCVAHTQDGKYLAIQLVSYAFFGSCSQLRWRQRTIYWTQPQNLACLGPACAIASRQRSMASLAWPARPAHSPRWARTTCT